MDFTIRPVETKKDVMTFIKCQWNFYRNDPNWVPPMLMDRKKVLDTVKNPFYQHSEMKMFLAHRNGDVIGRIAAIKNDNHNKTHNDKVGFFGFFECINNQEVANKLFDVAGDWLKSKGLDIMRGPENPSMNDEIGLLIEGFDSAPIILMTYNPPYYLDLVERAGFVKSKDLYAYSLEYERFMTDKLKRLQGIVREKYGVTIREVDLKNKTQMMKDVNTLKEIYNSAWVPNWGFVKWTDAEFDFIAADLKQVANQKLAIIAEIKGKPVGFALGLPNINECLIHNKNGGTLGGVWHLLTKKNKISWLRIIALGVIPEYQKLGIDSILYYEIGKRGTEIGIRRGEASWILEDNMMMNRGLTVTMNADLYKKYRLYDKEI